MAFRQFPRLPGGSGFVLCPVPKMDELLGGIWSDAPVQYPAAYLGA